MKNLVISFIMWLTFTCSPVFAGAAAVIDRYDTNEQVVAITCENIETAAQIENILQLCRDQGIQMTLFMRGWLMPDNTAILKKAAAQGIELGNYGLERTYWSVVDSQIISKELTEAGSYIKSFTGQMPQVVRPPFSYYDANFLEAAAAYHSAAVVVRGIDTGDWTLASPQAVLDRVMGAVKAGDIINIQLKSEHAVQALPEIIKQLKAKGMQITTVSGLKAKSKVIQPPFKPAAAREYAVVKHFSGAQPYVALTFDDGGGYYQTGEILDILKEYGIKSTFFLLGNWVKAHYPLFPSAVRRI